MECIARFFILKIHPTKTEGIFFFKKPSTLNLKLLQSPPVLHPATYFAKFITPGTAFGAMQQKINNHEPA
jgi:hypothetical protein